MGRLLGAGSDPFEAAGSLLTRGGALGRVDGACMRNRFAEEGSDEICLPGNPVLRMRGFSTACFLLNPFGATITVISFCEISSPRQYLWAQHRMVSTGGEFSRIHSGIY